jgi:polysaccharide biosynthesis protein PslH
VNILLVTPFLPYPEAPAGCPRAVYDRARLLAPGHRLTVVTFAEPGEAPRADALRALGVMIHLVSRDPEQARHGIGLWLKRARLAAGLPLDPRPMLAQEFHIPALGALLRRLTSQEAFDVALLEHSLMAQYLIDLPPTLPVILSEHDAPGALGEADGAAGPLAEVDGRKWLRYLRWAARRATLTLAPTAEDARLLAGRLGIPEPEVIPFGLAAPIAPVAGGPRVPDTLLFVGNFNHPPNADAARWLVMSILPAVRATRPEARVWLVGRDPTPEVRALAGDGVDVVGAVPAVAPYLARCAVFVAPLREGGGMRMKLIEALAAGAPVVTTALGAQGLEAVPGRDLLVAGSAAGLASAVSGLLADPGAAAALGAAGQALAARYTGPERRAALERALVHAADAGAGARAA